MSQAIQQIYEWIEYFDLSLTSLVVVAGVLTLVLVLSLREVMGWFTKTDSLRRELRRLNQSVTEMRRELSELKSPVSIGRGPQPPPERPIPYRDEFPLM